MTKLYRFLLVLILLVLVGAGLNISNHGIHCLTNEDRADIINAHIDEDYLVVTLLGENYEYSGQSVLAGANTANRIIKDFVKDTWKYLCKIWRIFRVLFFY